MRLKSIAAAADAMREAVSENTVSDFSGFAGRHSVFAAKCGGDTLSSEDIRLWQAVVQTLQPLAEKNGQAENRSEKKGKAGKKHNFIAANSAVSKGLPIKISAVKTDSVSAQSHGEAGMGEYTAEEGYAELCRLLQSDKAIRLFPKQDMLRRALGMPVAGFAGKKTVFHTVGAADKSADKSGIFSAVESVFMPVLQKNSCRPAEQKNAMRAFPPCAARKLAQGKEAIEARLDLHNYTQEEAYRELLYFVQKAHICGLRHILIITGKGRSHCFGGGVLQRNVPHWLAAAPFQMYVAATEQAAHCHGGSGALYVRLRMARSRFCKTEA